MSRFVRLSLLLVACAAPVVARAQQPGTGAPMPLAVDLAKVTVGSEANYVTSLGQWPPMNVRLALVNRTGSAATLEMSAQGGMMSMAGGKVVVDTVFTSEGKAETVIQKLIMQIGANDPMEMPSELSKVSQFKKPDPKTLVGAETVKVKAGSFKAKHYRDKTPAGDRIDYWVSEGAPPLGLVKMQAETKKAAEAQGTPAPGMADSVTMELVGLGKDAKPEITKVPKPFDAGKFRQQMMSGAGGPAPAPPSGPAPATPPAAPADKDKKK